MRFILCIYKTNNNSSVCQSRTAVHVLKPSTLAFMSSALLTMQHQERATYLAGTYFRSAGVQLLLRC